MLARLISAIFFWFIVACVVLLAASNQYAIVLSLYPLPYEVEAPAYIFLVIGLIVGALIMMLHQLGVTAHNLVKRLFHRSKKGPGRTVAR